MTRAMVFLELILPAVATRLHAQRGVLPKTLIFQWQLRSAVLANSSTTLDQYYYNYDAAGSRTSEQIGANVTQATPNNVNQISSLSSGSR